MNMTKNRVAPQSPVNPNIVNMESFTVGLSPTDLEVLARVNHERGDDQTAEILVDHAVAKVIRDSTIDRRKMEEAARNFKISRK